MVTRSFERFSQLRHVVKVGHSCLRKSRKSTPRIPPSMNDSPFPPLELLKETFWCETHCCVTIQKQNELVLFVDCTEYKSVLVLYGVYITTSDAIIYIKLVYNTFEIPVKCFRYYIIVINNSHGGLSEPFYHIKVCIFSCSRSLMV